MAIEFANASDEYIDCGSGATIDDIFDGGGSVALWIKPNGFAGDRYWLTKANSTSTTGWLLFINSSGQLRFTFIFGAPNNGHWRYDTALTDGAWVHVCVTYNADSTANDPTIYINGVSVTVTEIGAPVGVRDSDAGDNLRMGANVTTVHPNGLEEDVRVYTRVLAADEVVVLAAGYRGPLGGEVGWWSLQDAQVVQHWDGDSLATTDVIPDMSGNGNDGTPTNTPTARASEAPRFGAMLGWG